MWYRGLCICVCVHLASLKNMHGLNLQEKVSALFNSPRILIDYVPCAIPTRVHLHRPRHYGGYGFQYELMMSYLKPNQSARTRRGSRHPFPSCYPQESRFHMLSLLMRRKWASYLVYWSSRQIPVKNWNRHGVGTGCHWLRVKLMDVKALVGTYSKQ